MFKKLLSKVWRTIKLKPLKENKKKSSALANYGILIRCINELFSASCGQGHL